MMVYSLVTPQLLLFPSHTCLKSLDRYMKCSGERQAVEESSVSLLIELIELAREIRESSAVAVHRDVGD